MAFALWHTACGDNTRHAGPLQLIPHPTHSSSHFPLSCFTSVMEENIYIHRWHLFNLHPTASDIWSWKILCCGGQSHCLMYQVLTSLPGRHPPTSTLFLEQSWHLKMLPRICRCSLGRRKKENDHQLQTIAIDMSWDSVQERNSLNICPWWWQLDHGT